MAVDNARELARAGRKDEARVWLRYFCNSNVIRICGKYDGVIPFDFAALKASVAQLENEVHPATRSERETEFKAVKLQLDGIAFGVQTILKRLPR